MLAVLLAFSWMSWFNRVSMSVAYDEHIRNELGISALAIGYVYSALVVACMMCMAPGGWFADRFGTRLALTVMGLACGYGSTRRWSPVRRARSGPGRMPGRCGVAPQGPVPVTALRRP
jgi:MFS family permease